MKELILVIPADKLTWADRLRFAEIVREKVRRDHNSHSADFGEGNLTKEEWEQYQKETFSPRNQAVSFAIVAIRNEIKASVRELPDESAEMQAVDLEGAFRSA